MQMHVAWSWKQVGHRSLGAVSALSVEAAFSNVAHLTDRAAALAHLAVTESEYKGCFLGQNILSHVDRYRHKP